MEKQVELLQTQKHPKGDILKGTIYTWDESRQMYVYKNDYGIIVTSVNEVGVNTFKELFKRLDINS